VVKGVYLKEIGEAFANTWPLAIIAAGTLSAAAVLFRARLE